MHHLFTLISAMGFLPLALMAQISQHSILIRNPEPEAGFGVYVDERLAPKGTFVDQGCIQFSKGRVPGFPPDESLAQNEFFTSSCLGVFFETFLTETGDYFSADTIDAGDFERIGEKQVLPDRFYLAFTGPVFAIPEDTREHFGWVEIMLENEQPTIVDQAMAYSSPGIVIGSTATEPQPESIALSIRRAVGIQFQTEAGETYQMFTSLDGMDWEPLGEPFAGTGDIVEQFFPADKSVTFYKVEKVM